MLLSLQIFLPALSSGITGLAAGHGGLQISQGQLEEALDPGALSFLNNRDFYSPSKPKAFVNWILFDEQFKYVAASSGFEQVGADNTLTTHIKSNLTVAKNGYLYIYVSNETPNIDSLSRRRRIFFDNLTVTHIRGPILEETHYYPYGLTMAGISSKALNQALENRYKYNKGSELQNKEFSDGSGLEMYATPLRTLDQQLGRWWQIDPKPDYALSLYSSMGNNPILYNDPLGDTIRVDKSITGNKLLNSSFNAFAATKEGRKFLAKYAAKGQTIGGITFKKDGKFSKQGIDVNYDAQSFHRDKGGETSKSIDAAGRAQINVSINSSFYEKTVNGLVGEAFSKIGTLFHESFIHVDLNTKDFLDNKKFDYSNISQDVKKSAGYTFHYHHYQVLMDYMKNGYNTNNLWPGPAFKGLKQLNDKLKVFSTDRKLLKEMWDYNGGVELDDNGNIKR